MKEINNKPSPEETVLLNLVRQIVKEIIIWQSQSHPAGKPETKPPEPQGKK